MKLKVILVNFTLFTVLSSGLSISCTKAPDPSSNNNNNTSQNRAKLQIIVDDANGSGRKIQNPKVQLFLSNTDRMNKTNPVTSLRIGDDQGNVNFDSLQPIIYYYNAYSNDMSASNATTANYTTKLVNDALTKTNTSVR